MDDYPELIRAAQFDPSDANAQPHAAGVKASVDELDHIRLEDLGIATPNASSTLTIADMNDAPLTPSPTLTVPLQLRGTVSDVTGMSVQQLCSADEVYNIELAWLAFNWRVLCQARLPTVPLMERLRFLAIAAGNMDEFFAKRVGGLMRQRDAGTSNLKRPMARRWSPEQQLAYVCEEVKVFQAEQRRILHELLPEMVAHGLRVLTFDDITPKTKHRLQATFKREVELLLTPIKLDPGHPFPYLPSGSLNIAVLLQDPRQPSFRRPMQYAIVNIPSTLPRWIDINRGEETSRPDAPWRAGFLASEQVIMPNLPILFGGMIIKGAYPFRVTRNAEQERHEEEADDLLDMISDELRERRFAPFVRLEVEDSMPVSLREFLSFQLSLSASRDVYEVGSILDVESLRELPLSSPPLPESVLYPPWKPSTHPRLDAPYQQKNLRRRLMWRGSKWKGIRSIFSIIRDGEVLVHHPYQSFATSTQRLVEEAARDVNVVAIKATLYRTSSASPIVNALLKAAENGKQVAVLVELKARFDEARNVGYAQRLEDAGCNVAYGLVGQGLRPGYKTHCKCILVVRREKAAPSGLRTYCHIGTGNYNPSTAGIYTDLGLMTCDPDIAADVVDLFKALTGLHSQRAVDGYRKLLVASEYMRDEFVALIDAEIAAARAGRPAAFTVKVNGLDEAVLCAKIYEAAAEGVRVDLVVRGVCRVRPGVPGLSENIRVVSVVGRFLEHHRMWCFHNDGAPKYYIGSADWLARNLTRRVEVAVPVENERLKMRLRDILGLYLCDPGAWEMGPDGRYVTPATRAQEAWLSAPLIGTTHPAADDLSNPYNLVPALGTQSTLQHMTLTENSVDS